MNYSIKDIQIVRLLPMSTHEYTFQGKSPKEAQEYFKIQLPKQDYKYYFGKNGLIESSGALLLFQYDGCIIASAILDKVIKYIDLHNETRGYYQLVKDSVHTFEPIILEEFKFLNHKIKRFGQAKQRFQKDDFDIVQFLKRITNI